MGLSRACYDLNHSVGSRISICTMGTYDNCRYLTPSLTCLVTPNLEIFADRAVKYIMEPAPFAGSSIRFQPQTAEIYFGESTGPVARQTGQHTARNLPRPRNKPILMKIAPLLLAAALTAQTALAETLLEERFENYGNEGKSWPVSMASG